MWQPISTCPDGVLVMTKIDDKQGVRNEQIMKRGDLFLTGDMYVYYTPTHWRHLSDIEKMRLKNEAERKAIDMLERAQKEFA